MSTKISASEVLVYLNYLGYDNINAQQLKEFIQDLKKLIKYEERQKLQQNYSTSNCKSFLQRNTKEMDFSEKKTVLTEDQISNIFETLHSKNTVSSKARILPRKDSTILLQIKKHKCHNNCLQENKSSKAEFLTNEEKENVSIQEQNNSNKSRDNKKIVLSAKPQISATRTCVSINRKSDPVALYHYYESNWKRHKIPGEDNRTQLRWAIREKMMLDPRIAKI